MAIAAEEKLGTNRHLSYLQKTLGLNVKAGKAFFNKETSD